MIEFLRKCSYRKLSMHTMFWVIMLLAVFTSENFEYGATIQWHKLFHFVLAFLVFAIVSYYNVYYLIPKYFTSKQYIRYGAFLIGSLVVGAAAVVLIKELTTMLGFLLPREWRYQEEDTVIGYFFHIMFGNLMFILVTTFFYVLEELIRLQGITIQMKEVESQKVQSELQALKAQINPHFLFNTLNNIYSHSLDNSPQTPAMILKLSALMSYILYDCHEEQVPVSNELEFIKNYLELEKLRFEDSLEVNLSIIENRVGCTIAPLLLIPFIENAFKHGSCSCGGGGKRFVEVIIDIQKDFIFFRCRNSIDHIVPAKSIIKESGIGIENVKKRLELLYPKAHELSIAQHDDIYSVELKISEHGN